MQRGDLPRQPGPERARQEGQGRRQAGRRRRLGRHVGQRRQGPGQHDPLPPRRPEARAAAGQRRAACGPTLSIAGEGGSVKEKAIYSVELGDLRAGEQLVIDGRLVTRIGQPPLQRLPDHRIVLSENPDSASREGWPERVGDLNGQIAEANGFNCTQGDSAHEDPCTARKVGVLEITRDSPKTLYVNLVAGMRRPGRLRQPPPQQRHRQGPRRRASCASTATRPTATTPRRRSGTSADRVVRGMRDQPDSGPGKLGTKDSNLDYWYQRPACCHYTSPQNGVPRA